MEERYKISSVSEELVETFDAIGKLRRVFGQGGEIDYDQVSVLIVRDIREQNLGKLTFDFVSEQLEKEQLEEAIALENEERRKKTAALNRQKKQENNG
mgnify:FL=1